MLLLVLGWAALDFGGWTCSAAAGTNSPSRADYPAFKIITDRNIFNPRRAGRSAYQPALYRAQRAVGDSLALVGTMSYEKGPFAFFEGSSSEFRKVLQQGDTIAGFKVAEIDVGHVKLASATNQIELPIGKQLRRENGGEWYVTVREEPTGPARIERSVAYRRAPETAPTNTAAPSASAAQGPVVFLDGITQPLTNGPFPIDLQGLQVQVLETNSASGDTDVIMSVLERLRRQREQENNQ